MKQELAIAKAERDQAIGETFIIKQNGTQGNESNEVLETNRSLKCTLAKVKTENASLCQELDTAQNDFECHQKLAKAQESELLYLAKELEKSLRQRELLREKLSTARPPNEDNLHNRALKLE